jgi:hypothetical protein
MVSIGYCTAYTIGPMSADQHKQIERSIKQNESFEKSQELKDRSEKF